MPPVSERQPRLPHRDNSAGKARIDGDDPANRFIAEHRLDWCGIEGDCARWGERPYGDRTAGSVGGGGNSAGGQTGENRGARLRNPVGDCAAGAGISDGLGELAKVVGKARRVQDQPEILCFEVAQGDGAIMWLGKQDGGLAGGVEEGGQASCFGRVVGQGARSDRRMRWHQ